MYIFMTKPACLCMDPKKNAKHIKTVGNLYLPLYTLDNIINARWNSQGPRETPPGPLGAFSKNVKKHVLYTHVYIYI